MKLLEYNSRNFLVVGAANLRDQLEQMQNLHGERFHPHEKLPIAKLPIARIPIELNGICMRNFAVQW